MVSKIFIGESSEKDIARRKQDKPFFQIPVMIAVREGLHAGAAQWAFVNMTPLAASRPMLGVLA